MAFKWVLAKVLEGRLTVAVLWMGHLLAVFTGAVYMASYVSPAVVTSCGLSIVSVLLAHIPQVISHSLVFVRPSLLLE